MEKSKVVVVGSWHLGSVVGTCLAKAGNVVSLWDQNETVAAKWRQGQPPLHEPGLQDVVSSLWKKNLFWTDDLNSSVAEADWIVLAYDTPINDKDEVILDSVMDGFNEILKTEIKSSCCFFLTSQLPVGTSRSLKQKILAKNPGWKGHVVYQPENLRLGDAIKCFERPDRMVLGIDSDVGEVRCQMTGAFQKLLGNTETPINVMGLESAEMVKHALNSFLGTCVVFANEISQICEKAGADAWDVMASLKQDARVGTKAFLRPGLGFSGGTLARDVKTLSKLSASESFFEKIYDTNAKRNEWIINQLKKNLKSLKDARVTLLGVTYKPGTSTVRRSPAVDIAQLLKDEGARVYAIDPMADLNELSDAEKKSLAFELIADPKEALRQTDALVVVTEWPQFLEIDWSTHATQMNRHLVVDTAHFFAKKPLPSPFEVIVPGKPEKGSMHV